MSKHDARPLRVRRLERARMLLASALEGRDNYLTFLLRVTETIRKLERKIARLEKVPAPKPKPNPKPKPDPTTQLGLLGPAPGFDAAGRRVDDEDIPDFLRRKQEGEQKDAEARAQILAQQDDRKRNKTRARIEKVKAKQRGDTKKMPLTGKAALEFIRQG